MLRLFDGLLSLRALNDTQARPLSRQGKHNQVTAMDANMDPPAFQQT